MFDSDDYPVHSLPVHPLSLPCKWVPDWGLKMETFATWNQELFILVSPWSRHLMFLLQFSSVAQLCPTLCDPMNHSMPGLPVHHQLSEFTQTHIHWVSNTIQPSNPLLSLSPPTFNLIQLLGLFQWVSSPHQVAKVLEFQLQNIRPSNEYSGLISFRMDWLDLLAVQGTQKSSPTPKFKSINSSALSFLHSPTLTSIHDYWKNHSPD